VSLTWEQISQIYAAEFRSVERGEGRELGIVDGQEIEARLMTAFDEPWLILVARIVAAERV
jgi:hypothetical protein